MKKWYQVFLLLLFQYVVTCIVCNDGEFTQQKKKRRMQSVQSAQDLQRENLQACQRAFKTSTNLIEKVVEFQKGLQECAFGVVEDTSKTYQEEAKETLAQITNTMCQVQELLEACKVDKR